MLKQIELPDQDGYQCNVEYTCDNLMIEIIAIDGVPSGALPSDYINHFANQITDCKGV